MAPKISQQKQDTAFMQQALREALKAREKEEVPVGAVLVSQGKVIVRAHNQRESRFSALAHAEILAIQKASRILKRWRLSGCTLYITLEPCAMCAGAILESRMERVVFGTTEPKAGAAGSRINLFEDKVLNPQTAVKGNVKAAACRVLLQRFFRKLRKNKKQKKNNS